MFKIEGSLFIKTEKNGVTIHSFISPEMGDYVNSTIIETKNSVVIIDAQLQRPFAKEMRAYVDGLKKKIDRVIITHAHPDHWFGVEFFQDVPIYALPEVIKDIEMNGDFFVGYHKSLEGDLVIDKKILPNKEITEGSVTIDGLKYNMLKILDTERFILLAVELPELNMLVAGDLIYNDTHAMAGEKTSKGERCFDTWIAKLNELEAKNYDKVFAGHGIPGGKEVFGKMVKYLTDVKESLKASANGEELKQKMLAKYPDYKLPLMLDVQNYFIYMMP